MNPENSGCYFCKNLEPEGRRKDPFWIADLSVSTAFLSHNQICPGYTILVYNKAHAEELFQLEACDRQAYMEDLTKVAKAIYEAYHPHKMNYELLGNRVPHLHWHIIPRKTMDPVDLHWPIWGKDYTEVKLSRKEYLEVIEKIRKRL